jgi:hypothetical protein
MVQGYKGEGRPSPPSGVVRASTTRSSSSTSHCTGATRSCSKATVTPSIRRPTRRPTFTTFS